ncbi:ABC transporter substrate-binding protein [Leptospira ognonensis]|uniref:ABC transporter substrate-binding protein n=1 Tax=Leptospira ognonensis TaxID=2484945 RepID=A0A4R9JVU0_9LEPT|nr:ABC transporter substrate-binding protein [Leptospira ognonensis]TGL57083.1 ABC transporter substrate-binding protein [Leptospira ognonensis]
MRTISLIFLILSLTFCAKETRDFDIALAFPSDPPSLDPLLSTDLVSQKLAKFIFAGLYEFQNSKVIPKLVARDTFIPSKMEPRLEVQLRMDSGIKPEDVIFSLNRLRLGNSPRQSDYGMLKQIFKTSGSSLTILLEANTTESLVKEKLALPFASIIKESVFNSSKEFSSFGPYSVIEWKKNEYLMLKKNQNNHQALPDSILIQILPQSTTSLFLYKKDKIDSLKLTDFLLTIPEADSRHTIIKRGRSIQYVAINSQNPCFDKNFRYALNFAIPRDLIITKLLEGRADAVIGPIPKPFFESIFKNSSHSKFDFDKQKSESFLRNSKCYPKILESELEFRMRGDDENQAKGRAIVQALRDIGLKVRLLGLEKAPLYKENGEGKGDLTLLTWYVDYPSVWNFLDPLFHESKLGNGGNRALYANKNLTKRLDKKESLMDALSVIKEIEEDAPWIFLWSIQENYLVSERFIHHEALSDFL